MRVRVRFLIEDTYKPYISYVGYKHNKIITINFLRLVLEIMLFSKDWMIETSKTYGEKRYKVFTKNPKYADEKLEIFLVPKGE